MQPNSFHSIEGNMMYLEMLNVGNSNVSTIFSVSLL